MRKLYPGTFPQRRKKFYPTEKTVAAISVWNHKVWASAGDRLFSVENGILKPEADHFPAEVAVLYSDGQRLYGGGEGFFFFRNPGAQLQISQCTGTVTGIASDAAGTVYVTTADTFYIFCENHENGDCLSRYSSAGEGGVHGIAACGKGQVYLAADTMLYGLHGKRPRWAGICTENSAMPDVHIRDLASDPWGHIWLATDQGVLLYDARNSWYSHDEIEALPKGECFKLCIAPGGKRCFALRQGIIVQDGVQESFLGAERWMPDEAVTALFAHGDAVYVGTQSGLTVLESVPMTLADKAAVYEETTEKYHVRRGYVTVRALSEKNRIESGCVEISDNDGLWTGFYLGAQSMRYAVTGNKQALCRARRAKDALMLLLTCTGISGFPARAIRWQGDHGFGDGHPEWHKTMVDGETAEWKGETSSDEIVGHLYGLSFYYDLCADDGEKREIAAALCAMADHILENGFTLCDHDGLPTTWAHWGPQELNHDDIWFWERGINSLELLCILRTCMHMGGERYAPLFEQLVTREHYIINCMQLKIDDCHVNHIDDNLGFLTYAVLLRYETDPHLRQLLLSGMRQHWEIEKKERCPMWNLIFAAMSGTGQGIEDAVQSLCEMPLDLICYKTTNSHRDSLRWGEGQERFGGGKQLYEPLPYDEKPMVKYDNNPFLPDGGNGMRAEDGTLFLAPYWYGRYYGLLGEM